jgi:DNA-binding NarL/FixJ family response regulator
LQIHANEIIFILKPLRNFKKKLMFKVLIAETHPIVRRGLQQLLQESSEIVVAGEASDGNEALQEIAKTFYDLILLDFSLAGRSGLDVLRQLRRDKPELNVLILGDYPEEQYAAWALKEGARGYLTKERAPEELLTAVREIAAGLKYVSPALVAKGVGDLKPHSSNSLDETFSAEADSHVGQSPMPQLANVLEKK